MQMGRIDRRKAARRWRAGDFLWSMIFKNGDFTEKIERICRYIDRLAIPSLSQDRGWRSEHRYRSLKRTIQYLNFGHVKSGICCIPAVRIPIWARLKPFRQIKRSSFIMVSENRHHVSSCKAVIWFDWERILRAPRVVADSRSICGSWTRKDTA